MPAEIKPTYPTVDAYACPGCAVVLTSGPPPTPEAWHRPGFWCVACGGTAGAVGFGTWVVFDPTGRDHRPAYEVGVVLGVDKDENGLPVYQVGPNHENGVWSVRDLAAVLGGRA
jgi:hypothetical protein